jgi:hypothetical protein
VGGDGLWNFLREESAERNERNEKIRSTFGEVVEVRCRIRNNGGKFPSKPPMSLHFLPWESKSQAAALLSLWKSRQLISTPPETARRSRN